MNESLTGKFHIIVFSMLIAAAEVFQMNACLPNSTLVSITEATDYLSKLSYHFFPLSHSYSWICVL